jgi:phosphatidylserine/phosphatidylglycerophosphate/cardiolipin synthase-like enzyme
VLPDEEFGLMHGKAGVITLKDGSQTAFLGSANETKSGWKGNYEMLWEDDSAASVEWVQEEFDRLWNHRSAIPLSQAVGKDIDRLAHRKVVPLNNWQQSRKSSTAAGRSSDLPGLLWAMAPPEVLHRPRLSGFY